MIRHSFIFVLLYGLLVGVLMSINTTVFALGDPKFGAAGWQIYWPLWSVLYLPAVISALVSYWVIRPAQSAAFHTLALALILVAVEISFCFDVGWQIAVAELITLSGAFIALGKIMKRTSLTTG